MPIINFEKEIFVENSTDINPFTTQPFFAKLLGWNTETNKFVFDFISPITIRDSNGKYVLFQGEMEEVYNLDARGFRLIGDFKDDLLGILKVIKSAGAIYKIENIPSSMKKEIFKEELQDLAKRYDELMEILMDIDSGKREVEAEAIVQDYYNYDPEEGNLMPNLNGQFFIKNEDGELSGLASEVLVDGKGQPNWDNIRPMKAAGFDVFYTEADSFGWLGGAIRTKKGLIFFG